MRRLSPGSVLAIECTDPLAAIDIPHFARSSGFDLLQAEQHGGVLRFRLRKPG